MLVPDIGGGVASGQVGEMPGNIKLRPLIWQVTRRFRNPEVRVHGSGGVCQRRGGGRGWWGVGESWLGWCRGGRFGENISGALAALVRSQARTLPKSLPIRDQTKHLNRRLSEGGVRGGGQSTRLRLDSS